VLEPLDDRPTKGEAARTPLSRHRQNKEGLTNGILDKHEDRKERDPSAGLSFLVVTVGGIVEIAPLFYLENTIEDVEGVRPYSPLELAGRRSTSARAAMSATAR
jgi:hypothetical protein